MALWNDIVFDETGGFWFTDLGKQRPREVDKGAVYYAKPDGSHLVRAIDNIDHPNGCALSPDGSTLAIGTHQGRLIVFETEHYEQQLDWPALDRYVYSLAWTPDGTRLVTVGGDATVRVWDTRPRVVARREDDAWRALRASMAARGDLAEVYGSLEGEERAAARAELMRRRGGG